MTLRASKTFWLALWLGLVALASGAFEQRQFGLTTLTAAGISAPSAFAVPRGYHMMPDGQLMAGAMHGAAPDADTSGGSHDVPEDCGACAVIAAMAAFTAPVLPQIAPPPSIPRGHAGFHVARPSLAYAHPAYASRAPPCIV